MTYCFFCLDKKIRKIYSTTEKRLTITIISESDLKPFDVRKVIMSILYIKANFGVSVKPIPK
jgi:hypothetical protein